LFVALPAFAQSACQNENLRVVNQAQDEVIEVVGATFEQTLQFNVNANQLDGNLLRDVITLSGRVADELATGGNRGRCDIATHSRRTDHRGRPDRGASACVSQLPRGSSPAPTAVQH
jgi:hypothetical protein